MLFPINPNPFSTFTTSTRSLSFPSSSCSPQPPAKTLFSSQIEEEMGGVVKQGSYSCGLKQSVLQQKEEDVQNGVFFSGDDSFVDQFLNLQNADNQQEVDHLFDQLESLQANDDKPAFHSPMLQPATVAGEVDLGSVLALPEEDSELEWLSQFMEEDNFSQPYPAVTGIQIPPKNPLLGNETQKSFPKISPAATLPRSRRSKRRPAAFTSGARVWPIASSSATESTTSSSSSSSATSSPWPPTSPSTPLVFQSPVPPNPKLKKNRVTGPGSRQSLLARRCSHCGTQKTPQWRAGPQGLKTLCNACGVRFKSGRLFPEYRPASSPTFLSEVHSNSHRKVLEMRMKKDTMVHPEPGFIRTGSRIQIRPN